MLRDDRAKVKVCLVLLTKRDGGLGLYDADYWIRALGLEGHPEGGHYKETYRSKGRVAREHLAGDFSGDRNFATSILFLLAGNEFSALHRIKQDEVWYFHHGFALNVHVIDAAGRYSRLTIGPDPGAGHHLQGVVQGGSFFGASLENPDSYALVGCTCAPGFDFADMELPARQELLTLFPHHARLITQLTRDEKGS